MCFQVLNLAGTELYSHAYLCHILLHGLEVLDVHVHMTNLAPATSPTLLRLSARCCSSTDPAVGHGMWLTDAQKSPLKGHHEGEEIVTKGRNKTFRGVRQRPWGKWAAEIRDPTVGARRWVNSTSSQTAILTLVQTAPNTVHNL